MEMNEIDKEFNEVFNLFMIGKNPAERAEVLLTELDKKVKEAK